VPVEAIDLDEGPMIHYCNERWEAELDTNDHDSDAPVQAGFECHLGSNG
jgi:hypothetical protein